VDQLDYCGKGDALSLSFRLKIIFFLHLFARICRSRKRQFYPRSCSRYGRPTRDNKHVFTSCCRGRIGSLSAFQRPRHDRSQTDILELPAPMELQLPDGKHEPRYLKLRRLVLQRQGVFRLDRYSDEQLMLAIATIDEVYICMHAYMHDH